MLLLDTSATYHITYSLLNFIYFKSITPFSMKFPNGDIITASISGTVQLSLNIILHNVFYITKLIESFNCFVNFYAYKCLFTHNLSQKIIGIANRHGNLYVLCTCPFLAYRVIDTLSLLL